MFPRCFAIPQGGKSKETFENKGQEVGKLGAFVAAFLGAPGAYIRTFWECWRASVQSCPLPH